MGAEVFSWPIGFLNIVVVEEEYDVPTLIDLIGALYWRSHNSLLVNYTQRSQRWTQVLGNWSQALPVHLPHLMVLVNNNLLLIR